MPLLCADVGDESHPDLCTNHWIIYARLPKHSANSSMRRAPRMSQSTTHLAGIPLPARLSQLPLKVAQLHTRTQRTPVSLSKRLQQQQQQKL